MSHPVFQPVVSVVIPVSNEIGGLSASLMSVVAQTYPNIEILVVDSGTSTREVAALVNKFGPKVRHLSHPFRRFADALNFASTHLQGEYFSWLRPGDLYPANRIQTHVSALANMYRGRVIVYGDQPYYPEAANVRPDQFRYWLTLQKRVQYQTMLFPRGVFSECGLFDQNLEYAYAEEFCFRIAKKFRFVHRPEIFSSETPGKTMEAWEGSDREYDSVYRAFVDDLTADEIMLGSDQTPTVGYALIAESMGNCHRKSAARRAVGKSLTTLLSASPRDMASALTKIGMSLPLYRALKPGLKLVPVGFKDSMKRFLAKKRALRTSALAPGHIRDFGLKEKFAEVYEKNFFEGEESISGKGSDLTQTAIIRNELPRLVKELGIQSFMDAPCGDWFWMRECNLGVKRYIGVDIVKPLVERNNKSFARDGVEFMCLDLASDTLPQADLVLTRDCLEHLSYGDAFRVIENIKRSGAKYLATTTFTDREMNFDLGESVWRTLNKERPPFNFPKPLRLINEGCTEGEGLFGDKCLGVWKLSDIHLPKPV